jgi:16S rRNA (cytidine1402-2'-O)-methyltransferase
MNCALYLVPTPVGNLEDITYRALRILKEVNLVLAEDTRTTGILFKHFDIHTPMASHHKFNEHKTIAHFADRILAGESIALVSDAGTPAISDPGFMLVRECVARGIRVECLPGATAFVPALVDSGLPTDRFCFEGFLPQKKGRQTKLQSLATEDRTMIFYESPYRLVKTLQQFAEVFGLERQASVSREISKMFEDTQRGTLQQLIEHFIATPPKGEIVIVVAGADEKQVQSNDIAEDDEIDLAKIRKSKKYRLFTVCIGDII